MKRALSLIAALLIVFTSLPFAVSADEYENTLVLDINGYDCHTDGKDIVVYTNDTNAPKDVLANQYYFRHTKLMVFDKTGRLMEAGGDMYENSSTVTGSPQDVVTIPAGGFMVGFNPYNETKLFSAFNIAMEDAVLYNSTMSIIYDMNGSYNKSTNKFTLKYNDPVAPSEDAIKFLFVGNSSTYFNGTPIKFKGVAEAAGIEVDVDYCTFGSAFLSEFADPTHERGIAFRRMLKEKKYDYVVLQDAASAVYSTSRISIKTLLPLIEENGAEALLYMRYSAASTLEQNRKNAIKHHLNYSQLANYFELNCSPAAHAFIYSHEKYPEVPLYAIDGGHHSKEGSYLIALCWLYSFLGVDPVGNTYTADLDSATVAKLQECAKLAVDVGYPFDIPKDTVNVGGVDYENIAVNKPYTSSGNRYNNEKWTDTDASLLPIGKLTDGAFATAGDGQEIGAYSGSNISIVVDLKAYSEIKAIKTDLWGGTWGIPDPSGATVKFEVSEDGKEYTELTVNRKSASADGAWKHEDFTFTATEDITARYVKVTFLNAGYSWSSEVAVYGVLGEPIDDPDVPVDPETQENLALGKNYEISGCGVRGSYYASLTDGIALDKSSYDNNAWFGFYDHVNAPEQSNAPGKVGHVIIDLEDVYDVTSVAINVLDNGDASGISKPEFVKAYLSENGEDWNEQAVFKVPDDTAAGFSFIVEGALAGKARFVKVELGLKNTFCFINEVYVYGAKPEAQNVALNKEYEALVQDQYTANLTDGIAADKLSYDGNWFMFKNNPKSEQPWGAGNAYNRVGTVTIDLDGAFDLTEVKINAAQNDGSGISIPASVKVFLSNDGESWDEGTELNIPALSETVTNLAFLIEGEVSGTAKFVKIELALGEKSFILLNEIEIYGFEAKESEPEPVVTPWESGAGIEVMTDGYTGVGEITKYEDSKDKLFGFGNSVLGEAEYSFDIEIDESIDAIGLYTLDYANGGVMLPKSVVFVIDGEEFEATINENPNGIALIEARLFKTVTSPTITVKVVMGESPYNFPIFNMFTELAVNVVSEPPVPPVPEGMLGDVNNDGKIDQYDYVLVKRHHFNTRTLTDDEATRADANKDGKVDTYDYLLIARHYFGTYVIK